MIFAATDEKLLLRLLETPTIGPLEAGPEDPPPRLWQAQEHYAAAAEEFGMRRIRHAPAAPEELLRDDVPVVVSRAAADPEFLASQPSLVLRLGPERPPRHTVMFNVHLDTVSGMEPVSYDGNRFHGRGAVDAKGPAVALLAGIRAAAREVAEIGREITVLVQAVAGEEGGAMGTFGTRPLVQAGYTGRLNVFCEPTGLRWMPSSTASMTARIGIEGEGAIDDRPDAGHNATVLLAFLTQHLARELDGRTSGGRVCVAGMHTGDQHNRVYGSGNLLVNLSYATSDEANRLEKATESALRSGLREFAAVFAGTREFDRTAREAADIVRLDWLKRGLPTLPDTIDPPWADPAWFSGIARWPAEQTAFTCDAIWMSEVPEAQTVVLGPGTLEGNNAHATGEYVDLDDLAAFASTVRNLLIRFARSDGGTPR